jgi:hypothetical protein
MLTLQQGPGSPEHAGAVYNDRAIEDQGAYALPGPGLMLTTSAMDITRDHIP